MASGFDNVDNLTWSVYDILREGQRGNIIITSQDEQSPNLLKGCGKVSVDIMNLLEARSLLFKHLNFWSSASRPGCPAAV